MNSGSEYNNNNDQSKFNKIQYERYYTWFFPVIWNRALVRMATCNGRFKLENVEISPRFRDTMMRYTAFHTSPELIDFCQTRTPSTLQLGAVLPDYDVPITSSQDPDRGKRERAKLLMDAGVTIGKGPFILDVDISDFDRTGICTCKKEVVCDACWYTFAPTVRNVTEYLLKDVYGFKGVFAVFSGGRGIHYWVMDNRVIDLGPDARSVLFDTIQTRVQFDPHYQVLMDKFLRPAFMENKMLSGNNKYPSDDEIFRRLYPKYDRAVSVNAYHLKKLPLMLHQTTRNICLVLPSLADQHLFKPSTHSIKSVDVTLNEIERHVARIEMALNEAKNET